jgi:hypothetical protein
MRVLRIAGFHPPRGHGPNEKAHLWTVVWFGKHKGKTLPQIVLTDPDWFFWAIEEHVFNRSAHLTSEAKEISRKARRIKVAAKTRVEYAIHPHARKLADVSVVPASTPRHEGSSPTYVEDVLDLSMARKISSYDKLGGQIIVRALKFHVFGNENVRLTRQRCERFFNDDSNFAVQGQS